MTTLVYRLDEVIDPVTLWTYWEISLAKILNHPGECRSGNTSIMKKILVTVGQHCRVSRGLNGLGFMLHCMKFLPCHASGNGRVSKSSVVMLVIY